MDQKNRILLIGHNFAPEPTGIGKYSGEMISWLSKNDYDCTVLTTYPYYPHWQIQQPYKNGSYLKEIVTDRDTNTSFTVFRCPLYIPRNLSGLHRMLHDISFIVSMFFMVIKFALFHKKFDYILCVAPPFHIGYLALIYRKLRGGKLIYHVQDLQIEAAQQSNLLKGEKLFKTLYKAENRILRSSNAVSTISHGMINKIKTKINKRVVLFPNWVDTSAFFPINDKFNLKKKWGFNPYDCICLYSGAIGEKQGLESIINAAERFNNYPNIHVIICGTGPYKSKLQQLVHDKKLKNITFLPLQSKEDFNEFLNMVDLHLIIQKAYIGDLVMPSKLPAILSVGGVSLATAEKGTSLYEVYEKNDIGYVIDPDDDIQLAKQIVASLKADNNIKKANARKYAEKYLNFGGIMNQFKEDLALV